MVILTSNSIRLINEEIETSGHHNPPVLTLRYLDKIVFLDLDSLKPGNEMWDPTKLLIVKNLPLRSWYSFTIEPHKDLDADSRYTLENYSVTTKGRRGDTKSGSRGIDVNVVSLEYYAHTKRRIVTAVTFTLRK